MLKFLSGGKMGDFIHTMYVVKNLCEDYGRSAIVYIDNVGDTWSRGLKTAHADLYDLIMYQPYIHSFEMGREDDVIDINTWREDVAITHNNTGRYDVTWSKLLSDKYKFNIPRKYQWMWANNNNEDVYDCVLIHKSLGHEGALPMDMIFNMPCRDFLFITSNIEEWNGYAYKNMTKLYLVNTMYEMAVALNSCKLFVGNQSAPLALASALDVPRIASLNPDPSPFYMGEHLYSDNIMWYLDQNQKWLK